MKLNNFVELGEFINKGIPTAVIKQWTSYDDHEDIILRDSENNIFKIQFYPNKYNDHRIKFNKNKYNT